ncbi:MAG: LamG-like jellyroll fold domain-containing protein [Pirellulaceae bacterium]
MTAIRTRSGPGPLMLTRVLFALACLWTGRAWCQAPADSAVTWQLDNLQRIGGHSVTVVGAPRVIDSPQGKALEFDGQDDAVFVPVNPLAGLEQFTAEVIFQPYAAGPPEQRFFHIQEDGTENRLLFETRLTPASRWFLDTFLKSGAGNYTQLAEHAQHPLGPWYHAAVTVDGRMMRHFVNGVEEMATPVRFEPLRPGRTSIGVRVNQVHWFRGAMRTFRVTPRVLAPAEFLAR